MKKKITVAVYSGASKSTTFIERLIKGLIENNVKVLVFGVANGTSFQSESIKYHTYNGKINKLSRLCKYTLLLTLFKTKDKKKLDKIIKSNTTESKHLLRLKYYPVLYYNPDIFHLQWTKSIKDWVWVQEFGMKLVVSLRGTHITISPKANLIWRDLYLKLFPKVSAFHAVSESTAKEVEAYNVSPSKVQVVKSGLLLDELPFHVKKQIHKPLKIVSVGRSHFSKGYTIALDAMAILKEKKVAFHYTIIGVAKDESLIFQRSQLKLQDYVTFKEAQSFSEVKQQIIDSDILLLPSLEEGIANVVLEAMALGTLVISTVCGGMKEVVIDLETGFLIPQRNPIIMADKILEVSKMEIAHYKRITINALNGIKRKHSNKKMLSEFISFYEKTATRSINYD